MRFLFKILKPISFLAIIISIILNYRTLLCIALVVFLFSVILYTIYSLCEGYGEDDYIYDIENPEIRNVFLKDISDKRNGIYGIENKFLRKVIPILKMLFF